MAASDFSLFQPRQAESPVPAPSSKGASAPEPAASPTAVTSAPPAEPQVTISPVIAVPKVAVAQVDAPPISAPPIDLPQVEVPLPLPVSPTVVSPVSAPGPAAGQESMPVPPPVSGSSESSREHSIHANAQPDSDVDADLLWCLNQVVLMGASDLHLAVNANPRVRIHGALGELAGTAPWSAKKMRAALQSVMTSRQRSQFDEHLELDLALALSEESRFRVNVYQQRGHMGAAFRLIPTEIKSLSSLGVPKAVERFATLPRGLVLVTGPTGSGKSTTLAALIDLVNRTRTDHIVTVEDPIEFIHENRKSLINQREIGEDSHSFSAALKHVLRQDPDVILIGELRDLETVSTALTAAETGHLVFATLHTQSAGQTIDRVIDVFPPHQQNQVRAQLAATLQGVVCQTLVPRATGGGRVVATEILVANPAIANLIREGKTYQIPSALQAGRETGMHTLDQHLADLVNHGIITHQKAMEKAQDLESLGQLIHRSESMRDTRDSREF